MKQLQWKRVLRLAIAALVFLFLCFDIGLAWLYVDSLIQPGCPDPVPLQGGFEPERLNLTTSDGIQLDAWYYAPKNGAVILALGGANGSLGAALPPVNFLLERGYGVLQIAGRNCAGAKVTLGGREVLEALAAVAWLESQAGVDQIAAFGFSMGGVTAIRAAAQTQAIGAVVAEGGYYNLGEDFVEPGGQQSPAEKILLYTISGVYWLRTGVNPWQLSPLDEIKSLPPRPVFLVYGEYEHISGRAELQFEAAGEPKSLWIVDGGDHGTNYAVAPVEYESRVLHFFDAWRTGP